MQTEISILETYCSTWNLEINMDKSKIMVFRSGGNLAQNERWTFKGQTIETVSEYKNLGVALTLKISLPSIFKQEII